MRKHIGIELRSLNNQIMRYIENWPEKKEMDSITGTNGWIIGYISDHQGQDVFQKDLEEEFGITRSTASKVVGLMVQKGLIVREAVAEDARLKKLVLTEQALKLTERMKEHGNHIEELLTRGFSPEEIDTLYDYLKRLRNNIG